MFLLLIWIPLHPHLKLNSIQWHPFRHAHHQYLHQKRVFALQYTVTRPYFQLPNLFNSLLFTVLFHLWTIETFRQFLALTIDIWIKRMFRTSISQRYFTIVWTLFDFQSLLTWVTCLKLLPLIFNSFKLFRKIQSCRKSLHGSQSPCVKTKLPSNYLVGCWSWSWSSWNIPVMTDFGRSICFQQQFWYWLLQKQIVLLSSTRDWKRSSTGLAALPSNRDACGTSHFYYSDLQQLFRLATNYYWESFKIKTMSGLELINLFHFLKLTLKTCVNFKMKINVFYYPALPILAAWNCKKFENLSSSETWRRA